MPLGSQPLGTELLEGDLAKGRAQGRETVPMPHPKGLHPKHPGEIWEPTERETVNPCITETGFGSIAPIQEWNKRKAQTHSTVWALRLSNWYPISGVRRCTDTHSCCSRNHLVGLLSTTPLPVTVAGNLPAQLTFLAVLADTSAINLQTHLLYWWQVGLDRQEHRPNG